MTEQITIIVKTREVKRLTKNVKVHLSNVEWAVERRNLDAAYDAAEEAQMAAFELKDYIRSGDE